MKFPVTLVSMVLAAYIAGYLLVRWQFHSTSYVCIWTNGGWTTRVDRERTSVLIPWGGVERPLKQGLFWVFYPVGRLDQKMSGRVYQRTDARYLIID